MQSLNKEIMDESAFIPQEIKDQFYALLATVDLSHIFRITNQVGILQHARYSTPDYKHGYCIDDNSRALIMALMAFEVDPSPRIKALIETYFSFIVYMQLEDGNFRNFLSYDLSFLDEEGTEDSYGRTIWALGYLIQDENHPSLADLVKEIFLKAIPHAQKLRSPRAIASCLLGLNHYVEKYPEDENQKKSLNTLASYLKVEFQRASSPEWPWFEQVLAYDNALIPLSMLQTGKILQDKGIQEVGMRGFNFLDQLLFEENYLSSIGNENWYRRGEHRSYFGQQPVEIPLLILLYQEVYMQTNNIHYLHRTKQSFAWFFGFNRLGLTLYDSISKGCCDGLDAHGVNRNQGAESSISFWMAFLLMRKIIC